jgi:hypothetical protein
MSERKVARWFVQVEWDDGTIEQLYGGDIPDVVTTELQTYIQELEDYENGNWDMNYLNEGEEE